MGHIGGSSYEWELMYGTAEQQAAAVQAAEAARQRRAAASIAFAAFAPQALATFIAPSFDPKDAAGRQLLTKTLDLAREVRQGSVALLAELLLDECPLPSDEVARWFGHYYPSQPLCASALLALLHEHLVRALNDDMPTGALLELLRFRHSGHGGRERHW